MMGAMSLNRSLIWPECHDSKIGTQICADFNADSRGRRALAAFISVLICVDQRAILCFL
jgi:hypothetical protein